MIIDIDPAEKIEAKIESEIIAGKYKPHQKLLSERKLAEKLNTTPTRVHRAIQRLVEKGYLYTKVGHGTFVSEVGGIDSSGSDLLTSSLDIHLPHMPAYKTIKVSIPVENDPYQVEMWKKVLDVFREKHPFMEVEADFEAKEDKRYDVFFTGPYQLRLYHKEMLPLNGEFLSKYELSPDELCEDILKLGRVNGALFGIPVLRNPALVSVNKDLLEKYGVKVDKIKKPGDLLRVGDIIEKRSGGRVMGTRYLGFIYHGAMYGIDIKREGNRLIFNKEKVRKFLEETKPYIKRHHFKSHDDTHEGLFLEGHYAIYPHFYGAYQLEKGSRYTLSPIPFPRERDGFGCEGMFMGCIAKGSRYKEEALLFLSFLISEEGQRVFIEHSPNWLSVRKDVLKEQKGNSPFPEGALLYDFDIRGYYSQVDPLIFIEYSTRLNTEAGKFFLGLQGIEETIEKLEHV